MSFAKTKTPLSGLALTTSALGRAFLLSILFGITFLATVPNYMMPAAHSAESDSDRSKYIRLGVGKSLVIRLPTPAKDVIVGNPGIVDAIVRTQNRAYLFGRSLGQTNVFFFDAEGRQILSLDIEVARDPLALQNLLERAMPGTRITVDTMNDSVVLGGVAENPAEAQKAMDLAIQVVGDSKKVLSTIAITGREQVMLKVRVAEMQRNILKQLGLDYQAEFSVGKFSFDLLNVNPFSLNSIGALNGSSHVGTFSDGDEFLSVRLTALERDGLLRTLAEPTLTAISGESAKFLAGGEYPVPVGGEDNEVKIEFKPFGVGLGFTPVVMSEGQISMRISTEVSELSNENALTVQVTDNDSVTIPALKVRRAETTIELPSGGSMIMAGLIQDTVKQHINGIPGLKNLPILGTLFRSRDFQSDQTELVVIVTPYVVSPVNEKQLVTPFERFNTPTDRQTIFFGRLNKIYGIAGDGPKGTYHGNVGYIVE
jgi:pilus assembly protein CpaC